MKNMRYFKQTELMLHALPAVSGESCFALKGGTAINFFLRDMPRISVDIDLTYLLIQDRTTSLKEMSAALNRIADSLKKRGMKVQKILPKSVKRTAKLIVSRDKQQIKIEPNEVLRGSVYSPEKRGLVKKAESLFDISLTTLTLSCADLYGGKLCAALDRQHPRDLFDVQILLNHEGITDEIRKAFVVYLASNDRPIHELLASERQDMQTAFKEEFVEMTEYLVQYEQLSDTRDRLIEILNRDLTDRERKFLISIKSGEPDWSLLGISGIEKLPGLQWKILNVRKMSTQKRTAQLEKLKAVLKV